MTILINPRYYEGDKHSIKVDSQLSIYVCIYYYVKS